VTVKSSVPTKAGAVNPEVGGVAPKIILLELNVEVITRFFFATVNVRVTCVAAL
jgi:hypothetical protein